MSCQYCGTPINLNQQLDSQNKKKKSNKSETINDQMRNYEGSQEYQQMMRGEKVKKESKKLDKSKNFGCLQTIFEFIIYAIILSIFPSSWEELIVGILFIYWSYRFITYIRNVFKQFIKLSIAFNKKVLKQQKNKTIEK